MRDLPILFLVRMGSQSELQLGALSVVFMAGFLTWMATCSVRFRWERWGRDLRRLMLFLAILCPVVRESGSGEQERTCSGQELPSRTLHRVAS